MNVYTSNKNSDNSEYGKDGGNDTEDYIYLLNLDEAKQLNKAILSCGVWWRLRSPGYIPLYAAVVCSDGALRTDGDHAHRELGVRPALSLEWK